MSASQLAAVLAVLVAETTADRDERLYRLLVRAYPTLRCQSC